MTELSFACLDVQPERYAVAPTLLFRLRIDAAAAQRVRAIALRCQIRIEPARRGYGGEEAERLLELFGERGRWGDTLKPFQFANTSTVVASFTGSIEVDVAVPCSYDMEVTAGRYFHALEDGEIPFILLFSGTIFGDGEQGMWIEQVPWHAECRYRMPVEIWREMMDIHFPSSGWLRLRRDTIDALAEFRAARALPTWDDAIIAMLDKARERAAEGRS
ncbi:MAG: hypothetical protein JO309_14010 [Pseudonocardiales bacterium]|nr:hypothetical protein [Pseudonocardiales bacterium]MBV9730488.1 hypothetical protein [Pseudonocardiales bacterium]